MIKMKYSRGLEHLMVETIINYEVKKKRCRAHVKRKERVLQPQLQSQIQQCQMKSEIM